jgi:aspartyl-tRNA(Asn)/glutamyl-tRNA(Gln) amidotransferase subunit B
MKQLEPSMAKPAANLILSEVMRLLNEEGIELKAACITPRHIAETVRLTQAQTISSTGAKTVIAQAWKTGDPVDAIVERAGLKQVSDVSALAPIVDALIVEFPSQTAELKAGKEKLMGFFVGQVMKRSGGKANPVMLQELIKKRLNQ